MQFRVILAFFFLSSSLSFILPLLIPILAAQGLSTTFSATTQSLALLVAAFLVPQAGALLDRRHELAVFGLASVGIAIGAFALVSQKLSSPWFIIPAIVAFASGVATINMGAKRLTEGLSHHQHVAKSASLTYLVENLAVGCGSLLAYFFIATHTKVLITADVASTLIFTGAIYFIYRKHHAQIENTNKPSPLRPLLGLEYFRNYPQPSLIFMALLLTVFCHISAFPIFYMAHGFDAKKTMALMLLTNTSTVVLSSLIQAKYFSQTRMRQKLIAACLFTAAGHALVPFSLSQPLIVLSTIIWSIGESLTYPLLTTFILSQYKKEDAGVAVGVRDFFIKLSLVLTPLLTVILPIGNPYLFMTLYGGLPLIALGLILANRRLTFFA